MDTPLQHVEEQRGSPGICDNCYVVAFRIKEYNFVFETK